MKYIQYSLTDNTISIQGTNEPGDIPFSINCLPDSQGDHRGAKKAALKIFNEIKDDLIYTTPIYIEGHSMGGSIGQALGKIIVSSTDATVYVTSKGGFPALRHGYRHDKLIITERVHSNDPVPSLFPWFGFGCDPEYFGDDRKWYLVLYQFTQFVQSKGDHVTGY